MAEMVGGFLVPHNPALTNGMRGKPEQEKSVYEAFETVAGRVRDLKADTVIIIGDDHYTNFGPHCIPSCLIAIGDVDGPIEGWLGFEKAPMENNEALANHILRSGHEAGVDWAFAKSLTVDHSVAIPHHLALRKNPSIRSIPVYLNAGVEPYIPSRRAYRIGQQIADAVRSWQGDERVVIFGTGGISHWVGSPGMGHVNVDFDHRILEMAKNGDAEALIALSDEAILDEAGNGALEIKNWLCAMGALPDAKAEVIAYEAMPEWVTGMGFAELKIAA